MFQNKPIFQDFQFGSIYYVSSRVNGGGVAFHQDRDYSTFLKLVKKHLLPISEIYVYGLCPKTFDFLLCICSKKQMIEKLQLNEETQFTEEQEHELILSYFEAFIEEYQQYYQSNYEDRTLPLFGKFLKRIKIEDEETLKILLKEIHLKPEQMGAIERFQDWKFSSYNSYLSSEKASAINRNFLFQFFENKESFTEFHME